MTTITVVTPVRNYAAFVRDAIESVAKHTIADVEHVVQDGASTDSTVQVLGQYGEAVRWASERDSGQSQALNRAFARASGEWIAWLNADEFYLPGALEQLMTAALSSTADVIYGDAAFVDEGGHLLRLFPQHSFMRATLRLYGPFIPSCTMIVRREILGDRPWDERLRRIMDWDLYLRLANAGARFRYLPFPIAAYRVHSRQVTTLPASAFTNDYATVGRRYQMRLAPGWRYIGRVLHGSQKVRSGAYIRQFRARRLVGADLRWFRPDVGRGACDELLRRCYGTGRLRV